MREDREDRLARGALEPPDGDATQASTHITLQRHFYEQSL